MRFRASGGYRSAWACCRARASARSVSRGGRIAPNRGVRGMLIDAAVFPCASPPRVVQEDRVAAPVKAVVAAPAPGPERRAERDTEVEADRAADVEARTRRKVNDSGMGIGHDHVTGVHGCDADVGSVRDNDLRIRPEVAVVVSLLPFTLHRLHHVGLLREKCVAEFAGPVLVAGHHSENVRKREQGLHAWVEWKLI